jgi:hypothetical protein
MHHSIISVHWFEWGASMHTVGIWAQFFATSPHAHVVVEQRGVLDCILLQLQLADHTKTLLYCALGSIEPALHSDARYALTSIHVLLHTNMLLIEQRDHTCCCCFLLLLVFAVMLLLYLSIMITYERLVLFDSFTVLTHVYARTANAARTKQQPIGSITHKSITHTVSLVRVRTKGSRVACDIL